MEVKRGMNLKGLPNTKDPIECEFAHSASAALRVLRTGKAPTDAGNRGAINLWYDDDGKLRGTRCVHLMQVELKTFRTQTAAAKWYRSALKKIA